MPLATAAACPVCNTETGAAVRAGLFDDRFPETMAGILAPFPVLLAIVALLHFGWRRLPWADTPPARARSSQ
jgi:hypothetical protein